MKLLDDLFNSEKDVQLFYSELNGIEKKIEQLNKKKKDLENKLNKPKVNQVDFGVESKFEDPINLIETKKSEKDDIETLPSNTKATNTDNFDEKTQKNYMKLKTKLKNSMKT